MVGSAGGLLEEVIERLSRAGCVAAEEEAAEFLDAAPDRSTLDAWLARREKGEPHAWILGSVNFGPVSLRVDAGVYVPRHQSIELAQRAAALMPPGGRAVDLFTGTGAVGSALRELVAGACVVAVDLDLRAALCARSNGVAVMVADSVSAIRLSHWADVVTGVAPYVPTGDLALLPADVQSYEPRLALDGGQDGLDLLRPVVTAAPRVLKRGGWLVVEVGGTQDEVLAPLLIASGFVSVIPWRDDDGDLRGLMAQAGSGAFGHRP